MTQPAPPKRTMFAQQAVDFSDYFEMMFTNVTVGGDTTRRPKLAAPEGMSTGGGKQAVQHILLKSDGDVGTTLTVGSVDRSAGLVKLRTWDYLDAQHQQRFAGQPFGVDRGQYDAFFEKTRGFFEKEKLPVKVESAPAAPAGAPAASKRAGAPVLLIVLALLLLLLLLATVVVGGGLFYLYFIQQNVG